MTEPTRPQADTIPASRRLIRIFVPFVLGYFLSFAFRTVNAVISGDLVRELGVDATELGLLTATYFIAFAACQPVVGIMLDRYGPRRVDSLLLLVAAGGSTVFAVGSSLADLAIGRAFIGAGVSAALMASITAIGQWWPRERLPLMNGIFVACGALGAVFSTTPVRGLLTLTDWRGVFWGLAATTAAAAVLLWLVAPDRERAAGPRASLGELLAGLGLLYRSATFWRLAPAVGLIQGVFMAYISLWAGPWLRDVDGLSPPEVAGHLQWAALAMVAGYAGFGMIAEAARRAFGVRPLTVAAVGMAAALLSQLALASRIDVPPALTWSVYAFMAGAPFMGYAILAQRVPLELAGRANTALNLKLFVSSFAVQSGVGWVIDRFPHTAERYAAEGHTTALRIILAVELAAYVWMLAGWSSLTDHSAS